MLNPLFIIGAGALLAGLFMSEKSKANIPPPSEPTPEPKVIGGDWVLPPEGDQYADLISSAAIAHGIDERLLGRVLWQESRFDPEVVSGRRLGGAGEIGIAQFMPTTAEDLGIDPLNIEQSINGAAKYLRQLYDRFGSWPKALAAFNWGQGNLSRKGFANAPESTKQYVAGVTRDVFGENVS